jgi:hypothetical protein
MLRSFLSMPVFHVLIMSLSLTLLLASSSAAAGPLGWARKVLGIESEEPKTGVVEATPGAVSMLLDQPMRLTVDAASPEAQLPQGRSFFRRVELPATLADAQIDVRVIAQESDKSKNRTVFKPLFYVLDDEGNVRETVPVDPLNLDMRPFQTTALAGCVRVKRLQRFLVATTEKDVGKSYESGARDSVKANSKGGFYYSTDAVKVKLPYAATGELVLTVTTKPSRPCIEARPKDAKTADAKTAS